MKKFVVAALFSLVASTAAAGPLGVSRDGNPPGTIADLTGIPESLWSIGMPAFAAGKYALFLTNGFTGWKDLDVVTTSTGMVLQEDQYQEFTSLVDWTLHIVSPQVSGDSTGVQFAWFQVSPTTWICGIEDLLEADDYQDKLCAVSFLSGPPVPTPTPTPECLIGCGPEPTPEPTPTPQMPVPEPETGLLVVLGLIGLAYALVASKAGKRQK